MGSLGSSGALAQSGPLAPFAGPLFEGFETQHTQAGGQHPASGAPALIGGLFSGAASLSATSTPFLIQLHGGSQASCGSVHRTGGFQLGAFLCEFSILFDADQVAFGGYFASDTIDPMNLATRSWQLDFVDGIGNPIGGATLILNAPCGDYQWAGWALPPGTRGIDFTPSVAFRTLLMDDLVASPVAPIGEVSCMAAETSVEERAQCRASGSVTVAANTLTLHAERVPTSTFGFFLASRTSGFVVGPAGSAGNLCLGGSIGRYVGPGQIQNSGSTGSFSLPIDLQAIPQPAGAAAVVAGERWYFQAWFRDVTTGGTPMPTSNFTAALAVDFE
ncbi:hypothetical protein Poly30_02530 [Planctomycetes bacterium Poly30]|uniref:Uncharacterized protein n=1 Tax=Saltatorellus ferox TaxID=2528018 RepID=A0A518EKZ8_9BACT|nr:hypothetical protein Poly30_02530 [Planctomycetes bacterium Poly30]